LEEEDNMSLGKLDVLSVGTEYLEGDYIPVQINARESWS